MVESGANFLPTFACAVPTIWTPGRFSLGGRGWKNNSSSRQGDAVYSRPLPSRKGIAAHRLYQSALEQGTVETPMSDQPKCKDLVVVYGRWSLTRIKPQGASSKKWSRHICCMENHLLHAISKLGHVQFHVVTKVLRIFKVAQCTQRTKR